MGVCTSLFRLQHDKHKARHHVALFNTMLVTSAVVLLVYVGCATSWLAGNLKRTSVAEPHTDAAQRGMLNSSSCSNSSSSSINSGRTWNTWPHSDTSQRALSRTAWALSQQAEGTEDAVQQQWREFWASGEVLEGLKTLQSLRTQVSMSKYQRLQKDVEPQDTAGLDSALADTLDKLAQQTQLGATQAWVKVQITAEVFKVLNRLQHPEDCASARKLVCVLNKPCGFACQIHHVVHCLTHAVALNRTMVLKTNLWTYSPGRDGTDAWLQLMAPISSCGMHHVSTVHVTQLPAIENDTWQEHEQDVFMDVVDQAQTSLELPAMPPDVLQLVRLFNSRPETWWVGVLSTYLLRPSAASVERHAAYRRKHAWQSPVVGVHIRRTDKVTSREAKSHSVTEYMSHVERYCDLKLGRSWQRHTSHTTNATANGTHHDANSPLSCTIYLATDDAKVYQQVVAEYPHIRVLANPTALATGATKKRNSEDGAQGVYDDILLLSSTDYLVGTFSSQVSRLAYELAQVNGSTGTQTGSQTQLTDPSLHYHSVDSMWYFGGMNHYEFCATHDYTNQIQVQLQAGQHLECSAMHSFKAGLMKCTKLPKSDTEQPIYLPPAILARCETFTQHAYRNILPHYMQQPHGSAQADAFTEQASRQQ